MTVSIARKYPDLFQKTKTKNMIDANFGIMFKFNTFKAAFHHIRKETLNGNDFNYFPLPSPPPYTATHATMPSVELIFILTVP